MSEAQANPNAIPEPTIKSDVDPAAIMFPEPPRVEAPPTPLEPPPAPIELPAPTVEEPLKLQNETFLSSKDLELMNSFAKENGLTNKQAQLLLDRQNEQMNLFAQKQIDLAKEQISNYETQVKADPDIGGNNFNQSITTAQRVLTQFASPGFRDLLDKTGFGSHPEMIKTFVNIGKLMQNDTLVNGGRLAPSKMTAEERIYGKK